MKNISRVIGTIQDKNMVKEFVVWPEPTDHGVVTFNNVNVNEYFVENSGENLDEYRVVDSDGTVLCSVRGPMACMAATTFCRELRNNTAASVRDVLELVK